MTAGSVLAPQVIPLRISTSGKAKHEIDTNTLVEIKSDTPDVTIYYTIDGSKPQLFGRLGYRDHNTFMYKEPITLPDGKITVKALAVTKDYRESAIVTKIFVVTYAPPNTHVPNQDNENFLKDLSRKEVENELSDLSLRKNKVDMKNKLRCSAVAEKSQGLSKEKVDMSLHLSRPHLMKSCLSAASNKEESNLVIFVPQSQFTVNNSRNPTSSQTLRIQRETDFMCAQCLTPQPSDPVSYFCQKCGSLSPSVPKCSTPPLVDVKGKVLCHVCGAENPVHIKQCVICDSHLHEEKMRQCHFICFKCGASSYPYGRFCGICSLYTEHSSRLDPENMLQLTAGDYRRISENENLQTWEQSLVSLSASRPDLLEKKEQGTQTTGLFYPSSKLLKKKECEMIAQKEKQNKTNDHNRLLTAISPGRGYWRKQLDHVCAHLRSYAQNNLAFRTLIGEPQMGKLISATVHKDDYQISLQINYALAVNKDILASRPMTFDDYDLSPSKAASKLCQRISSRNKMTETRKSLEKEDRLNSESRQLLKELGPEGHGDPFLIEQLIDEGADPNCTNNDDQPVLTLAVLNNHHEAIPVLVQKDLTTQLFMKHSCLV
ncbi:double zinc ribbon and ankyrin repeat-containing protein 1 isoform X2 [Sceloporus undulatus]|uniref:double zinc ribbon and ankyrin repeat-containing protein 1 isoform X2 n=1 Tax=Sceloporus undulatus TaxID=8520 RepID=UPI001C4B54B3|nr:double zinc ribbon and ankyrin repeat-containing protein 1 isoform X2 [Sceloporus undulatus]